MAGWLAYRCQPRLQAGAKTSKEQRQFTAELAEQRQLLVPAGKAELRHHLQRAAGRPYWARLADFHLLLWLAKQPNLDRGDLAIIAEAVKEGSDVPEGYTLIIDSLAEL